MAKVWAPRGLFSPAPGVFARQRKGAQHGHGGPEELGKVRAHREMEGMGPAGTRARDRRPAFRGPGGGGAGKQKLALLRVVGGGGV